MHLPKAEHHILSDVLCLVLARSVVHTHLQSFLSPRAGFLFKCTFLHLFLQYTY